MICQRWTMNSSQSGCHSNFENALLKFKYKMTETQVRSSFVAPAANAPSSIPFSVGTFSFFGGRSSRRIAHPPLQPNHLFSLGPRSKQTRIPNPIKATAERQHMRKLWTIFKQKTYCCNSRYTPIHLGHKVYFPPLFLSTARRKKLPCRRY